MGQERGPLDIILWDIENDIGWYEIPPLANLHSELARKERKQITLEVCSDKLFNSESARMIAWFARLEHLAKFIRSFRRLQEEVRETEPGDEAWANEAVTEATIDTMLDLKIVNLSGVKQLVGVDPRFRERLHYPDVRSEDPVSKQAGASSRVDFLIRDAGVIVETKMTRKSLVDKGVGEELLIDWGRYQRHPDCRGIFALVYDPGGHLHNPAGLEHDLSQGAADISTRVIVVC